MDITGYGAEPPNPGQIRLSEKKPEALVTLPENVQVNLFKQSVKDCSFINLNNVKLCIPLLFAAGPVAGCIPKLF